MKSLFSLDDNIKFSEISGDNNKIHLDHNYTKKLFFKFPIVHGVHIVIFALSKFLKKNNKKKFVINYLNIKFNNYLNINENFKVILLKNKILVKTNSSIITEIHIATLKSKSYDENTYNIERSVLRKYYFKNLKNISILKELLELSKFIGTKKPGHGSLILNLKIALKKGNSYNAVTRKVSNRLFHFIFANKKYLSNLIVTKPKKLEFTYKKFSLEKKTLKKIKNKSVLIFGSTGALGAYAKYYFSKYPVKIYLPNRLYKKKRINKLNYFKIDLKKINNLKKLIMKINPDIVLYFISPKIKKSYKNSFDLQLYKNFKFYYYVYFKKLIENLKKLDKKIIVFYPSTKALNKNFNNLNFPKEYIHAKKFAEKKFAKNKNNKVLVKFYRIDKIQSLQNYNIAGFYEGKPVETIKKNLDNFIKKY